MIDKWIEGFTKAAKAAGHTDEQIPRLVKIYQQQKLAAAHPKEFKEGFDKQAAIFNTSMLKGIGNIAGSMVNNPGRTLTYGGLAGLGGYGALQHGEHQRFKDLDRVKPGALNNYYDTMRLEQEQNQNKGWMGKFKNIAGLISDSGVQSAVSSGSGIRSRADKARDFANARSDVAREAQMYGLNKRPYGSQSTWKTDYLNPYQ